MSRIIANPSHCLPTNILRVLYSCNYTDKLISVCLEWFSYVRNPVSIYSIIIIKICLVFFNRVSGHEDGLVLLPESNKVTIFFTSDSERPDTGFNMTFEAVEIKQGNNIVKNYISQE